MLLSKRRSIQLLFACLMAVGLLLSSSMAVTAQGNAATINGVNYSLDNAKGLIKVVADTTAPVQYKQLKSNNAICVEISPAVVGKNVKRSQNINTGLLQSIVVAQTSANVVLVRMNVSDTPKTSYCTALAENKGVSVAFSKNEVASAKVAKAQAADTVAKAGSNVAPRKVAAPAKKAAAKKVARKTAVNRVKVVNMEFVNADLVYIVKFLAKEMGRNVYVGPDVQGSVTVTLKNVQPEGALALVLKMQETPYDYKIVDNTVIVATSEKLQTIADNILTPKTKSSSVRKNLSEQEFILESAPAANIIEFLKGQYPDVVFTPHPTINGFYAKATPQELKEIKSKLPNLDQVPAPPPAPRREYITVNYGKAEEIQTLLKTLVPDITLNLDKRMGILVVEGTDEQIEQVQEVLANIDRPLKQVMLDFKVVELNETGSKNLGVQWSDDAGAMGVFNTTFAEIVPSLFYGADRHMITNEEFDLGEDSSDLTAFNLGTFGRSPLLIKASISFVVENSDSKTLASPRIATQSGEKAEVYVGQRYPIVFYDPRAGQFQVQYVDIGTKLEATPEVKDDGHVVVELTPTTSSAGNLVNNQYPITYERTAKSKVRVKDGDTIVLGGLISDSEKHSVSKLPLLGDLPVIGALFRYESHSSDRSEVVFMVTPHIMD
ncbi:MAG: secretin N-terminal domain-containing protein [Candidatus Bruticola sp.]